MIQRLRTSDAGCAEQLAIVLQRDSTQTIEIRDVVTGILADVRQGGDAALLTYTSKFDGFEASSVSELEITKDRLRNAFDNIEPLVREALQTSVDRVLAYHQKQKDALGGGEWVFEDEDGNELGQLVRGLSRVGIYAPGGKASYPSTVIMTAVPAKVAGVSEITLVVPAPGGEINETLLAAAHLVGVDRVFTVGGAQAIAALAYGTETIGRVDKIVGPGNIYVATAKQMVFGDVGIDMVAGPSEVVIVADDSANLDWLVMDMFAQAEHDEMAQAILVSWDDELLDRVAARVEKSLQEQEKPLSRLDIIRKSIDSRGALIKVDDVEEAMQLVNRIAPEHLEIVLHDPEPALAMVQNAGAIFVGNQSAEVVGDYTAGPSHVLPTGGTARFASPLGVYDFQVRSSLVRCSAAGAVKLNRDAAILAREEGLDAHAESAEFRVQG
ncbi:MAG: histidinol dehydrogenase [Gammaproteobacteria bacterium]|jgi:histidinol dehydrogenase|nr:histidinol dehydrogenase [Gammaproteobacteria bacterium]|tara:strand:+ start:869 stop:2188 length:1320 start_codon:yes stop_codon:yes gene_type:complete